MLDIQFIRDNPEAVETKAKQKGYDIDIQGLLKTVQDRRAMLTEVEELRRKRNEHSDRIKQAGGKPDAELIEQGKAIKDDLTVKEQQLTVLEDQFLTLLKAVPNMPLEDVPVGSREDENVVAKTVGEQPKFDFEPKEHWQIAEPRDLIDKARAAKIAGSRFAYIKGDLVRLQFAIVQFVLTALGDEQLLQKLIDENGLK